MDFVLFLGTGLVSLIASFSSHKECLLEHSSISLISEEPRNGGFGGILVGRELSAGGV